MWTRDLRWIKFGSRMGKSRIRDKHPGSTTLITGPNYRHCCEKADPNHIELYLDLKK
jgi:hypothetical protein